MFVLLYDYINSSTQVIAVFDTLEKGKEYVRNSFGDRYHVPQWDEYDNYHHCKAVHKEFSAFNYTIKLQDTELNPV